MVIETNGKINNIIRINGMNSICSWICSKRPYNTTTNVENPVPKIIYVE